LKNSKALYLIIAVASAIVHNYKKVSARKRILFDCAKNALAITAKNLNKTIDGLYREDGQHWERRRARRNDSSGATITLTGWEPKKLR